MARILITPRSLTSDPPAALDRLRHAGHEVVFCTPGKTPGEAELLSLVPGIDGWLAGVEPVSASVIAAADRLQVISRNGTGTDSLPMPEIEARGIRVTRALGANATGVAELALGLILAACRHLPDEAMGIRAGQWPRLKGREIEGAVVGIVGMGAIGRRVARVLSEMGAEVIAHDPFRPDLGALAGRVSYVGLVELLSRAEIVSLHCPMPEGGRPLLDGAALGVLPQGAILVNTARAGLVDEAALIAALDAGRLATYGTDVFEPEPPAPGGLASHPRVIATSHIGGLTDASVRRATEVAVENLLAALAMTTFDHAAQ
ncbi:phosphoglycerate dehydrogenase [Frigidibacter sp. MR17.24]|uniref:phosphoglycerate dehydrogenase n=1 Tax=Frigidibacter sp. MR17.24 TaxID=3127345 RepID=UPI003012BA0B